MAPNHWRSDYAESLKLGEAVTISILRDQRLTYKENYGGSTFTKFDGTRVRVCASSLTVCGSGLPCRRWRSN
jgi:hypothetical protein